MLSPAALATLAGLVICDSLCGEVCETAAKTSADSKPEWSFSFEALTYLAQHARDYANPNFTADNGWLHLEARYNYEALKTGSVWLGYNVPAFNITRDFKVETATPMLGGVFGDLTGAAPGYLVEVTYKETITASTQGEYFLDAGNNSRNFFYSWSEFSAPLPKLDCIRAGLVVERTQASGNSDVRRGPLVGFKHKVKGNDVELTAYWLAPGSREATFVFGLRVEFQ